MRPKKPKFFYKKESNLLEELGLNDVYVQLTSAGTGGFESMRKHDKSEEEYEESENKEEEQEEQIRTPEDIKNDINALVESLNHDSEDPDYEKQDKLKELFTELFEKKEDFNEETFNSLKDKIQNSLELLQSGTGYKVPMSTEEPNKEMTLEDLGVTEEEWKKTLEELDAVDFGDIEDVDDEGIMEKIEDLPKETQEKIKYGVGDLGFLMSEASNKGISWLVDKAVKKTKEGTIIRDLLESTKESFDEKADNARKNIENREKGILTKTLGMAGAAGNLLRWGRILHGYNLSNPIRLAMVASTAIGSSSEIFKRTRIKGFESQNEKDKENIRNLYQSNVTKKNIEENIIKVDEEEANIINEKFNQIKKSDQENKDVDIERVYKEALPETLKNRIDKRGISKISLIQSFSTHWMESTIEKINKKISEAESEQEKQVILNKYDKMMKDLDVLVNKAGTIDTIDKTLLILEKYSKGLSIALTAETVGEIGYKMLHESWSIFDNTNTSIETPSSGNETVNESNNSSIEKNINPKGEEIISDKNSNIKEALKNSKNVGDIIGQKRDDIDLDSIKSHIANSKNVGEIIGQTDESNKIEEEAQSQAPTISKINPEQDIPEFKTEETPQSEPEEIKNDEWMLHGEDILKPKEDIEYQGGRSIWKEAEKQLEARFENLFDALGSNEKASEALKTYNIDRLKDEIMGNPEKYGLGESFDARRMTKEMIANIDWNEAFQKAFPKGALTETLTQDQIDNIVNNNKEIRESFKQVEPQENVPIVENRSTTIDEENTSQSHEESTPTNQPEIEETPQYEENKVIEPEVSSQETPPEPEIEEKVNVKEVAEPSQEEITDYTQVEKYIYDKKLDVQKTKELLEPHRLNDYQIMDVVDVVSVPDTKLVVNDVTKHLDFALNNNLRPEESAHIIKLLEQPNNKEAQDFFESFDINRTLDVTSAQTHLVRDPETLQKKEGLELYCTVLNKWNKVRRNIEVLITNDGFFISEGKGGYGSKMPLNNLSHFLKDPPRLLRGV